MRTATDIDEHARAKIPLVGPNIIERGLWSGLRAIYDAFDNKQMPIDGASKAKAAIIAEYAEYCRWREIFLQDAQKRIELAPLISEANIHGCEICKQIAEIYDGRASAKA
jgi:hypothetical protein